MHDFCFLFGLCGTLGCVRVVQVAYVFGARLLKGFLYARVCAWWSVLACSNLYAWALLMDARWAIGLRHWDAEVLMQRLGSFRTVRGPVRRYSLHLFIPFAIDLSAWLI